MNEQQTTNAATAASGQLRAGVGKSDITTNEEGIVINDPLYARALVLDDGKTQVVIIAMDATAIGEIGDISDDFLPALRHRLRDGLGIEGSHVIVNASHTHPPGRLLCDDEEQVNRTFRAVEQALQNMTPVKIGWGAGHEDRITMNRNLKLKNGKHWTIRHANPCPPDEDVVGVNPIDPEIGILRIDRLDGTPFAVVFNFAGHPLFGAPYGRVTADFPGIASGVIEDNLGHGAMALFLQGAGGDIVDVLFKDFNRPRNVEPIGMKLGLSTLKAWRDIETSNTTLNIIAETIDLPRRTDIPGRIATLREEQAELLHSLRSTSLNFKAFLPLYLKHTMSTEFPADYSFTYLLAEQVGTDERVAMDEFTQGKVDKYLANIYAMEKLARIEDEISTFERHKAINDAAGEPTINAEVVGLKIGDCVFITAPIEILTQVSLNIKNASPYEHTFVAAFSNGYMHYGPPAADYDKGGYEVIECFLAPEWQQIYENTANDIIRRL